MQFNSIQFIIFFPLVLGVYFIVPRRLRSLCLIAASYYFYMSYNVEYALILVFSTLSTWLGALLVWRQRSLGKLAHAKLIMAGVIVANLGILVYFKYANFILSSLNRALAALGHGGFSLLDVLLPVGISFFIFQAIGYLIDVYRNKLKPELNLASYTLFVCFFPQLLAGPIGRANALLPQIHNIENLKLWDFQRIQRGGLKILYGFLMKVVIADRAAIAVNTVFADHLSYSSLVYLVVIFLFTIQIYCDFAGYSNIAIGTARMLGINLMENFRVPYLARSMKEFWSRWHISLSSWFMDYLYIPLGGNRLGLARKCLNLLLVFAVSGLWHGASWHFVFWGLLHACLRVAEELSAPGLSRLGDRLHINKNSLLVRLGQTGLSFVLVSFAWLFFRADNLSQGLYILASVLSLSWLGADISELGGGNLGLLDADFMLLLLSMFLLFCCDFAKEKNFSFTGWLEKRCWPVRASVFLLGILAVLVFGAYGPGYDASTFIYFQF